LWMKMWRGSIISLFCIPWNHALGHAMLMQDYFSYVPTYPSSLFCRRYQMRRQLYLKIGLACKANCRYFTRRRNGIGTIGFSAFHERCVHGNLFSHG
jgi:hypothetical protein